MSQVNPDMELRNAIDSIFGVHYIDDPVSIKDLLGKKDQFLKSTRVEVRVAQKGSIPEKQVIRAMDKEYVIDHETYGKTYDGSGREFVVFRGRARPKMPKLRVGYQVATGQRKDLLLLKPVEKALEPEMWECFDLNNNHMTSVLAVDIHKIYAQNGSALIWERV